MPHPDDPDQDAAKGGQPEHDYPNAEYQNSVGKSTEVSRVIARDASVFHCKGVITIRGIVISTDNMVEVKDFAPPLYQSLGEAVGGTIELVRPRGLARPFVMIVNDEGLLLDLPLNRLGSILYETHKHGSPIVGNIVIMKEGMTSSGPDIIGLDLEEEDVLIRDLREAFQSVKT